MSPQFSRLFTASTAMHATDQLTLAAAPLIAAVAGADPATIGLIVAAQSAAWLLISLPVGALADRLSRRTMLIVGAGAAIAGSLVGLAATGAQGASLLLLGLACFIAAAGIVTVILSVFALAPSVVAKTELPRANSRLELARALVTLAAPSLAAFLILRGQGFLIFVFTGLFGLIALLACRALPRDAALAQASPPILAAIRDGARFVIAHPTLRAIALCAIFWNAAFFALIGMFAPFAIARLGYDAQAIGHAGSALGAGLVAGALAAPGITARVSLSALLLFGPAVSVLAGLIIAFASRATPEPLLWLAFFLIGFGPILWAITQTSLRQTLTPSALMGRVGATMQVATYGARPLGALIAGLIGARFGLVAAAALPALLFAASLASMVALRRGALTAAPAR